MKKMLMAIGLLLSLNVLALNRYVSLTGSNTNAGTSVTTPWRNISYAASYAGLVPGDTVFVKSGLYGNEQVVITKSGTKTQPIVFKGYINNPAEFVHPIVDMDADYSTFTVFNSNTMPTLDAGKRNNALVAFKLDGVSNVTVMNFQVQDYGIGYSSGTMGTIAINHVNFINCNAARIGNTQSVYAGKGIQLGDFQENKYAKQSYVYNSLFINCAAEGIEVSGDSNQVIGCRVYCYESSNYASTDYYLPVFGSYNLIQSCRVSRTKDISTIGYGIIIRSSIIDGNNLSTVSPVSSIDNKITLCISDNMGEAFVVRHSDSQFNSFYSCTAYNINAADEESSVIVCKDGTSNNTFESIYGFNNTNAVTFSYSSWYTRTERLNNNNIQNCNLDYCINSVAIDGNSTVGVDGINSLLNNTFYKCINGILANRASNKLSSINNIFYLSGGSWLIGLQANTVMAYNFNNSDIYGVTTPSGFIAGANHCITVDPLIISDNSNGIQSASPCRTTGLFGIVKYDLTHQIRTNPTTMGCFMYYSPSKGN